MISLLEISLILFYFSLEHLNFKRKLTFPLFAIKICFDIKRYKLRIFYGNGWNLLINTMTNLYKIFWLTKYSAVLFFLAVLMSSLVLSCRSVTKIVYKIFSFWKLIFFYIWKYELRSSIFCIISQIFAILSLLYFGTIIHFTSLVLNTYNINDTPFSYLQRLLS